MKAPERLWSHAGTVIAEPLSLEDRSPAESAPSPRTHADLDAPPASDQAPSLTVGSVTSSLQLILAMRRAARLDKRLPES